MAVDSKYIAKLDDALSARLRPMGYFTRQEGGIQFRLDEREQTRYPDISIYAPDAPTLPHKPETWRGGAPLILPMLEALQFDTAELDSYVAISIYDADKHQIGLLELLSPVNLPGRPGHPAYREKRREALSGGLIFIEIDLHNHHRSLFEHLHRDGRLDDAPYLVAITDPRPDIQHGQTIIHTFRVDEPIPTIDIPLNGDDKLTGFDLDSAYQAAYEQSYFGLEVDYAALPTGFDDYNPKDQATILARLKSIQDRLAREEDLDG